MTDVTNADRGAAHVLDNNVSELLYPLHAAQGSHDWLATEFVLEQRSKLVVAASGQIDLFPQNGGGAQFLSTPKGNPNGGNVAFVGKNRQRVQPGTLIGRVGEGGTPFVIGENYEGNPGGEGKLYLQITPSPWSADLSGSYQVKISAK